MTLDDDVVRAIESLRAERRLGLSAALNELARRGMVDQGVAGQFVQQVSDGGARLDVSDVAAVLGLLEESDGS